MKIYRVIPLFVLGVAFSACTTVPINPNDSTPPKVEIKVKGADGQYQAATATDFKGTTGKLDLMCVVDDPEGVKSLNMIFSGHSSTCTTQNGGVYSGSYKINGLPSNQTQNLTGGSAGKVPTTLGLFGTINGPLSCSVPIPGSPSQPGTPYGAEFSVGCVGSNWSADNQTSRATKTLYVTIK